MFIQIMHYLYAEPFPQLSFMFFFFGEMYSWFWRILREECPSFHLYKYESHVRFHNFDCSFSFNYVKWLLTYFHFRLTWPVFLVTGKNERSCSWQSFFNSNDSIIASNYSKSMIYIVVNLSIVIGCINLPFLI